MELVMFCGEKNLFYILYYRSILSSYANLYLINMLLIISMLPLSTLNVIGVCYLHLGKWTKN
jgi:hypothetical protein